MVCLLCARHSIFYLDLLTDTATRFRDKTLLLSHLLGKIPSWWAPKPKHQKELCEDLQRCGITWLFSFSGAYLTSFPCLPYYHLLYLLLGKLTGFPECCPLMGIPLSLPTVNLSKCSVFLISTSTAIRVRIVSLTNGHHLVL